MCREDLSAYMLLVLIVTDRHCMYPGLLVMPHWPKQFGLRYLQRSCQSRNLTSIGGQGLNRIDIPKSISIPIRRPYSTAHATKWRPMSSAQNRLQQLSEQIRKPSARAYSDVGIPPKDAADEEIICSTEEHSPGQNFSTITFSNPRKINIVNSPLLEQIIETCKELAKDDNLRVVVLTGGPTASGKAPSFIGGMDIREMTTMDSYEVAKKFITHVHNTCEAFRQVPVPVIAKVHGFSLGAGLEIMASCDLRIATKASTFGMPEVGRKCCLQSEIRHDECLRYLLTVSLFEI